MVGSPSRAFPRASMGTKAKCGVCGEPVELPEDTSCTEVVCPHCSNRFQVRGDRSLVAVGTPTGVTRTPRSLLPESDRDEDEEECPNPPRRLSFRKYALTREEALDKVRIPATILQLYGGLLLLAGFGCLIGLPFAAEGVLSKLGLVALGAVGTLSLACGFLTLLGGTRLGQLRSFGLVLATIIITFCVALFACTPLIVVGIWPLVVFMDVTVREHFDQPLEEIEADEK
jgi:DNA-directed RNA polymerase subunit RPC12/RpoP